MRIMDHPRVVLEKDVLEAYRDEYKDLVGVFQALDTKAQGTVAIAGIFIAGIFAFLPSMPSRPLLAFVILAAVLHLVAAVTLAVFAMRVRVTVGPPNAAKVDALVDGLLSLDDRQLEEALPNLYGERNRSWSASISSLQRFIYRKADLLWSSQVCLIVAIGCVAISVLLKMS